MKLKTHTCKATITIKTSVNDGPPSRPITLTVTDGSEVTIMQPVTVSFAPDKPIHMEPLKGKPS